MIKPVEATAMLASCNMWLGGLCCSDSYTKLVCFLSHPVVLSSFIQLPLQLDYHLRCELSKKKSVIIPTCLLTIRVMNISGGRELFQTHQSTVMVHSTTNLDTQHWLYVSVNGYLFLCVQRCCQSNTRIRDLTWLIRSRRFQTRFCMKFWKK